MIRLDFREGEVQRVAELSIVIVSARGGRLVALQATHEAELPLLRREAAKVRAGLVRGGGHAHNAAAVTPAGGREA